MTRTQYKHLSSKRAALRRKHQQGPDKPPTLKELGLSIHSDYEEAKAILAQRGS